MVITVTVLYRDVRCGLLWGFVGRLRFPKKNGPPVWYLSSI